MTEIDKIEKKITAFYDSNDNQPSINIPLPLQVGRWISFSKNYLSAAEVVEKEMLQCWLPIRQLLGQSIELSLKACILAVNKNPSHSHNLIELLRICEKNGFKLENSDIAAIVHLNHFYFRDLSSETKFKSRYPAENNEQLGGVVPNVETYATIVKVLHKQATQYGQVP